MYYLLFLILFLQAHVELCTVQMADIGHDSETKKPTFGQGRENLYKPWPLCKGHGISKKHLNLTFQEEKTVETTTF